MHVVSSSFGGTDGFFSDATTFSIDLPDDFIEFTVAAAPPDDDDDDDDDDNLPSFTNDEFVAEATTTPFRGGATDDFPH